jgi:RNA recognition motif-containing protein
MSHTVFFGNLPVWVTDDDIMSWLTAEGLIADSIKVIRNPQTQESKGYAFIEAPNDEEMQAIIRRFNRAPLEDRILRANAAQPPRGRTGGGPPQSSQQRPADGQQGGAAEAQRRARRRSRGKKDDKPKTLFGEQLAKAL